MTVVVQNPDNSIILATNETSVSNSQPIETLVTVDSLTEYDETFDTIDSTFVYIESEINQAKDTIKYTLVTDFIINLIAIAFIYKSFPISIINLCFISYAYIAIYTNYKLFIIVLMILLTFMIFLKLFLVAALYNNIYNFINILSLVFNFTVLKNLKVMI